MVDNWYDYQTLSTLGYNESSITECIEKDKEQNTVWTKIVMMTVLSEGWGKSNLTWWSLPGYLFLGY